MWGDCLQVPDTARPEVRAAGTVRLLLRAGIFSLETKQGCNERQSSTLGLWQIYYMCSDSHNQEMQDENLINTNISHNKMMTYSDKQEGDASSDKTLDLTLALGSISRTMENSDESEILKTQKKCNSKQTLLNGREKIIPPQIFRKI